jgi:hypothetical protein
MAVGEARERAEEIAAALTAPAVEPYRDRLASA